MEFHPPVKCSSSSSHSPEGFPHPPRPTRRLFWCPTTNPSVWKKFGSGKSVRIINTVCVGFHMFPWCPCGFLQFPTTCQKHGSRWIGLDVNDSVNVLVRVWVWVWAWCPAINCYPIQGVFPSHTQSSCYSIYTEPDQDKAATDNNWTLC